MNNPNWLNGVVKSDGALELAEPTTMPPGPVEVLIRPVPNRSESWWEYLEKARSEMVKQGYEFRRGEEIERDRARERRLEDDREDSLRRFQDAKE